MADRRFSLADSAAQRGKAVATAEADVLATNDMPDLRRDGAPDSVYNTGVTFFRAGADGRALRFALECVSP